jgi:hypothetical protein
MPVPLPDKATLDAAPLRPVCNMNGAGLALLRYHG